MDAAATLLALMFFGFIAIVLLVIGVKTIRIVPQATVTNCCSRLAVSRLFGSVTLASTAMPAFTTLRHGRHHRLYRDVFYRKPEVERRPAVEIICGPEFSSMRGYDGPTD